MEDIEKKRLYIYNLIHNNKDDKINHIILYFIKTNKVPYSENKNGYFINLMTIESNHINYLYNLVKRLEPSTDEYIDISEQNNQEDIHKNNYEIKDNEITEVPESLILSENEKKLIEYTKMI